MDGDFELNKPGWYTPKIADPNEFLNEKLTTDQYGIYYSVQFEGDADTYLWQTKTEPAIGETVYGHIEKSASGKSLRFKKDKLDSPSGNNPQPQNQNTSNNITLGLVYKTIANIRGIPENDADASIFWEIIKSHVEELIMISDVLNGVGKDKTDGEA